MVSSSPSDFAQTKPGSLTLNRLANPIGEWLFWMCLALFAYSQTGNFSKDIAEYAFGASGWPRTLCLAIALGATGQLAYQIFSLSRSRASSLADAEETPRAGFRWRGWRLAQQIGIFGFPLLYLYVMPDIGFYVATPLFIIGLLVLLEVKSPLAILTVTSVVCSLVLLLFTRLFYVALPVGNIESFYNLNNTIIEIVRSGM